MFQGRSAAWWIIPGAVLLACLYVPTLTPRFDFSDAAPPGAAAPSRSFAVHDPESVPFQPVASVHAEILTQLLGDQALAWHAVRLAWTALTAALFLWLLAEFGCHPLACLGATALLLWNPWHNEVWTSLTRAEGVALPYALLALLAAVRARQGTRVWLWEIVGCGALLLTLGSKNSCALLLPVQLLLRVLPLEGESWRVAVHKCRFHLPLLGLPLLLSSAYCISNQTYDDVALAECALPQLEAQLPSLMGALSLKYVGPGLLLGVLALVIVVRRHNADTSWQASLGAALHLVWKRQRLTCLAAALLLGLGLVVTLLIPGSVGQYNLAVAWGSAIGVAALLSSMLAMPRSFWSRCAGFTVACGLVTVAVENVDKQNQRSTRAEMLWGLVDYLETHAPPDAHVVWTADNQLDQEEGVQLLEHLHQRGRADLRLSLRDVEGHALTRYELPTVQRPATLWVSSGQVETPPGRARRMADFRTYPLGRKPHHCVLWQTRRR